MRQIGMITAMLLAGYVGMVAVLALSQTLLLFPRWMLGPSPALPADAVPLAAVGQSGVTLQGHLLPATAGSGTERPLVLGFGGNATDARELAMYLREVLPEHDVAGYHYRGYGPSRGRPSAAALLDDALMQFDALRHQLGERSVLAVGFSIGVGPAAHLARERPLVGVVLVTPFDSLHAVARQHYPWLPVAWLLRHRMEPLAALTATGTPIALISARRDTIIPAAHAEALARGLGETIPGVVHTAVIDAGHNDIYDRSEFRAALREAVQATGG